MTASDDGGDPWVPRKRRRLQSMDAQTLSPGSPPTLDPGIRTRCASPSWDQDAKSRDPWAALEYPMASQYCFGMLSHIPVKLKRTKTPRFDSKFIPVVFKHPNELSAVVDGDSISLEISSPPASKALGEMTLREEITMQLYCYLETGFQASHKAQDNCKQRTARSLFLRAIIYGRAEVGDAIGQFLSREMLYLQDPINCDRDVIYQNPHNLSRPDDSPVMTGALRSALENLDIEWLDVGPGLLARLLEGEIPFQESEAPAGVVTSLFSHQKQALTFMLRRERGWALKEPGCDVWAIQTGSHSYSSYVNNVTGACQTEAPPEFRGGLLADEMGLGKTLSIICLVVANVAPVPVSLPTIRTRSDTGGDLIPVKSTLLIVPPPLICTWENQLRHHLQPDLLSWYVFHGKKKKTEDLGQYDIVITTFQTVSAAWRGKEPYQSSTNSSLFSSLWFRVILDEAHIIQNRNSQLAKACYGLHAINRWVVTGTPIQNKLTDFASLVRFLRVYPYSDMKVFEQDISRPWQRSEPVGLVRLKTLVRYIAISRTKAAVNLPTRIDEVHRLDFSTAERQFYEAAKFQAIGLLDQAISSTYEETTTFNALQKLNTLRLICNHGVLAQKDLPNGAHTVSERGTRTRDGVSAENLFENDDSGSEFSAFPDSILNPTQSFFGDSQSSTSDCVQIDPSQRGLMLGGIDHLDHQDSSHELMFTHNVSQYRTRSLQNLASTQSLHSDQAIIESMSTKIKALMTSLEDCYRVEKCVVFSYWTQTLDFVELMLKSSKILYTRIDGKVPLAKRSVIVERFQEDSSVRVILVSITCGGAGLNLTAASRAFLLEPLWNPMVEEQALCRIYRIGQQRNVTTVRYLMRDSFEEQVVDIQTRKKALAKLTFDEAPLSKTDISLTKLQYLRLALG